MTWTTFHHRGEILRAVIAAADTRRDGLLPLDVAGVSETFGDELTLLAALQLKWHTRLAGQIERALADQPMELDRAVESAWSQTASALPGVRLVLDHYRAEPTDEPMAVAMGRATGKEHMMMAVMAGRASVDDAISIRVGAHLEEAARLRHRGLRTVGTSRSGGPRDAARGQHRLSLLDRLKAVVAA